MEEKFIDLSEVSQTLEQHGYTITGAIGQGAFATVLKIYSTQYQQDFVAKTIFTKDANERAAPGVDKAGKMAQGFEAEIAALSKLDHPNVIQIYDHIATDDFLILILEYCENGSIQNMIDSGRKFQSSEFQIVARQVISALQKCHASKIAHRDIKPANILIDKYGRAKLADFGLSKLYSDNHPIRYFCGSLLYMAPELFNKTRPSDPMKADVWSLGVTFYTILVGKTPWVNGDGRSIREQICLGNIVFPNCIGSHFRHAIHSMLNINPDLRPTLDQLANFAEFKGGIKSSILSRATSFIGSSSSYVGAQMRMTDSLLIGKKVIRHNNSCMFYNKKRTTPWFLHPGTVSSPASPLMDATHTDPIGIKKNQLCIENS